MDRAFPTTADGFVLASDIRSAGREAELYAAVRNGTLERVRRGVFAYPAAGAAEMSAPERDAARYRSAVRACAQTMRRPVFTSYSAIALARLPIVGPWPRHHYLMSRDGNGSRRRDTISVARTADVPTVITAGLMTTTLEFSLVQLGRHAPLAAALVATDAALRASRSGDGMPLTTLQALWDEHERLLPYHGSRRVAAVFARAVLGADTPLETTSRLVIEEFGFPVPVLQHRLALTELGRSAFLDFFWPEYGVAAEADGRGKYLGDGVDATVDAVLAEKAREDAIRAQVGGFARWDWAEMWQREPIRVRLVRAGLPITRRPARLFILT